MHLDARNTPLLRAQTMLCRCSCTYGSAIAPSCCTSRCTPLDGLAHPRCSVSCALRREAWGASRRRSPPAITGVLRHTESTAPRYRSAEQPPRGHTRSFPARSCRQIRPGFLGEASISGITPPGSICRQYGVHSAPLTTNSSTAPRSGLRRGSGYVLQYRTILKFIDIV